MCVVLAMLPSGDVFASVLDEFDPRTGVPGWQLRQRAASLEVQCFTRGDTTWCVLPDWHELLVAFSGHCGDHPITRWAQRLTELHARRDRAGMHVSEIDSRRAELAAAIDRWTIEHAYEPGAARAAGLGAAVDEMARAYARADRLLCAVADVGDGRVHAAWFHLARLAQDWADRTAAVTARQPYSVPEMEIS
jgi:hypothetical protein